MKIPQAKIVSGQILSRKMASLWCGKSRAIISIFVAMFLLFIFFLTIFLFQFVILVLRVIQQSHPVCNTIMLFGIITCLVSTRLKTYCSYFTIFSDTNSWHIRLLFNQVSVILLGIDGQFVDSETYPKVSWVAKSLTFENPKDSTT